MQKDFIKGIDGLRALAVIAVIIYHIEATWLPGGFSGVDIFFVISGYVVAKSLESRRSQNFNTYIIDFYRRRLVRIYPALLFLLITVSMIVVLFIPRFFVSKSIDDTALFAFFGISNFFLAFNNDTYFSPAVEFNPFVHTWSLGVEEQFYLIFPFLFFWVHKKKALYGLIALTLLSIFLSYYHTSSNTNHAYYLITSRFWELAAGGLLFIYHRNKKCKSTKTKIFFSTLLGIVLTTLGLIFSDKAQFPFPWAFLSVFGTCFLIHAIVMKDRNYNNLILSIFETRPMIHLGKLSYSLYLWHWAIFSLFRWTSGLETFTEIITALILTYTMAFISFRFVETKIPALSIFNRINSKKIVTYGLNLIGILCFITWLGFKSQPITSFSNTANRELWSPYYNGEMPGKENMSLSGRTIFVLGDSHAGAYQKMLKMLSDETGIAVKVYSKAGCGISNLREPVLIDENLCYEQLLSWINEIKNNAIKDDIIFLATLKMYRLMNQSDTYPNKPQNVINSISDKDAINLREEAYLETLNFIEEISSITQNIMIDAPKPVFNYIVFRCADWYTKGNPICSAGPTVPRDLIDTLREPSLRSLEKLTQELDQISVWDPIDTLCSSKTCSTFDNTKPIYFDSDHLSGYGNKLLYPSFKSNIFKMLD